MNDKPNFYASDVCTSHLHCDTCRARHAGRTWRKTLRRAFRLPEDDFDCPEGKPWIEDRTSADKSDAPRAKPCGGCAQHRASRPAGSLPLRGSGSDLRPSVASGCGKTGKPPATEAPMFNVDANGDNNSDGSGDNPADPWEAAGPPLYGETRASCMECVEKHVAAAMVLLSETKNGYPHYLLAVGHLHEAAEEAQAWPDLAAAIRSARKELQTTGTVPDWEGIMGMMGAYTP